MLNDDQKNCLEKIKQWWASPELYFIIEGKAGTGKTYLTLQLIKELVYCKPLITATTHEAVRQLSLVTGKDHEIKTTYSALGFGFDSSKKTEELKQLRTPLELENYNLLIIDEASYIGSALYEAILKTKMKVLFIGHRNQLPEVVKKISSFDRYDSIIFKQNFPIYTLTVPVRNSGRIFEYCNKIEFLIDSNKRIIPKDFDISKNDFEERLFIDKENLQKEKTKVICWRHELVDSINDKVRKFIFGGDSVNKFLPQDRLILTSLCFSLGSGLERYSESKIFRSKNSKIQFNNNSTIELIKVETVSVLGLECYKLHSILDNEKVVLYTPVRTEDLEKLYKHYLQKAYGCNSQRTKENAFRNLHFLMKLFAQVKHSYCITAYKCQGMTIPRVIVRLDDISRYPNIYVRFKMLYTSCSRASEELMVVR